MSRLTDKNVIAVCAHCNSWDICKPDEACFVKEVYEKLKHLEDLEEQGRLIEQKHGRWIHKDNFIGKYLMCSECSHVTGRKSNYCPNCGAKMDEVEND